MIRMIKRMLPLFLAVLFLLAAAGTSFFVILGETRIYAEETSEPSKTTPENKAENPENEPDPEISDPVITKVTAEIDGKTLDLIHKAGLTETQPIDVLTIEVEYDGVSEEYKKANHKITSLKFNNDIFEGTISDENFKITFTNSEDDKYIFKIELHKITFNFDEYQREMGKTSISITYDDNKDSTVSLDIDLKFQPLKDNFNILSYQFLDNGRTYNSSIHHGTVLGLEVTVCDEGITETTLRKQVDQHRVKISFSNNNFKLRNGAQFKIKDIKPLTLGGVQYTIVCDNNHIEYMGLNQQLALLIDYGNQKTRTVSKNVNECVLKSNDDLIDYYDRYFNDDDDDDDDESSRPYIAPPTPNIIITNYDYGGGNVTAASKFDLKITFKNTSKRLPIDNIVMKVTVPEAFTMTSSSNTFYVEKLGRNSSVVRTMGLSVKPNAEPISHPIQIEFSFEAVIDETRKQFTSDEEISIPVAQLDRFAMNNFDYPEMIFVGEGTSVEATFINKGKTEIYNVSAEITGNISQSGQKQFIGNVEGGKEESADFMINADIPGEVSGEVIITYEDANMNVGELRSPFCMTAQSMDVMSPDETDMAMNPEEFEAESVKWYSKLPVWTWIAGSIVLIIAFAFVRKLIRAHQEKLLEEQDEDF